MTEREKRREDKRRTEIAMMRHLIEQYPRQALDQLRELQNRARTVSEGRVQIVVQSG